MAITSKQRAHLRSLANSIDPILHVGKSGLTPEFTVSADEALDKRELIKIDVLNNCMMEVQEIADIIHERTRSEVVQVIGKKIVLFRRNHKKPVIEIPRD